MFQFYIEDAVSIRYKDRQGTERYMPPFPPILPVDFRSSIQENDQIRLANRHRLVRFLRSPCLFNSRLCLSLSHRTLLPLMYPPHSISLGSIYLSSLLLSFEQQPVPINEGETGPAELANILQQHSNWETKFKTKAEDLDGK